MQKVHIGSALKKRSGFEKKVAPTATRILKELHVSHVSEQLKEPSAKHFLEP